MSPSSEFPNQQAYMLFNAGVRAETVNRVLDSIDDMLAKGVEKLYIAISSTGGNVTRGFELFNFLKGAPLEVTTHNVGDIDSIANVIYLAGSKRFSNNNARFLMHGVARSVGRADGDGIVWANEKDLTEALAAVQVDHNRIARTIAEFSSMKFEEVRQLIGDTIFTPDQAREKGLVHEICAFQLPKGHQLIQIHDSPRSAED